MSDLTRRPHQNTGEPAPIGFATVGGLTGEQGWTEQPRAVPGKPDLPPDHWIEQRAA